jgi:hypothetical protein
MFYLPVKGSFLPIIWTVLKSLNYDKIKISWEMDQPMTISCFKL